MRPLWFILTLFIFTLGGLGQPTQARDSERPRKLIEFGWESPTPDVLRREIATLEALPFDGTTVQLNAGAMVFTHEPYPESAYSQDQADLAAFAADPRGLTDNFVLMWATMEAGWRWEDEADWAAATVNIRNFARMAFIGGFKGVLFDSEIYGANPWAYSAERYDGQSFSQVNDLIRSRGAEFMQIVQEEIPDVRILTLWLLSYTNNMFESQEDIAGDAYALYPAFIEGMFSAAADGARIIDGNESSYYYTSEQTFITERAWILGGYRYLGESYHAAIQSHLDFGNAVYIDGVLDLWDSPRFFGYYLADDRQRLELLEHNVYYALKHSDEYVWVYSENMNWRDPSTLPDGILRALERAKTRINQGEPVGVDVTAAVAAAQSTFDTVITVWGQIVDTNGDPVSGVTIHSGYTDAAGEESACVVYLDNQVSCVLPLGWEGELRPAVDQAGTFEPATIAAAALQESQGVTFVFTPGG
jgi:hypothetical protein